jgi:hypothetical protein
MSYGNVSGSESPLYQLQRYEYSSDCTYSIVVVLSAKWWYIHPGLGKNVMGISPSPFTIKNS